MIERLHCNLKAILHTEPHNTNWFEHLSLILLGHRMALKREMNCSTREVLYETILRFAVHYLCKPPKKVWDLTSFVDRLTTKIAKIGYLPSGQNKNNVYLPKQLDIFIHDTARSHSQQSPHCGPFWVMSKHEIFFTLRIKNKELNISLD